MACKFWRLLILLEITREIPASTAAIMRNTRGVGTASLAHSNGFGGDVGLELKLNASVSTDCTHNFRVDFGWNSTPFDHMHE